MALALEVQEHDDQQDDHQHAEHVEDTERRQRAGTALEAGEEIGNFEPLLVSDLLTADQHAAGK